MKTLAMGDCVTLLFVPQLLNNKACGEPCACDLVLESETTIKSRRCGVFFNEIKSATNRFTELKINAQLGLDAPAAAAAAAS